MVSNPNQCNLEMNCFQSGHEIGKLFVFHCLNYLNPLANRRILGYRLQDYMSNDLVLRVAGMRHVTCLVRERQLRTYGHVVRLPAEDPANRVLSCRDLGG